MLTSADALGGAPGPYVDKTEPHMAACIVRGQGQGRVQFRLGRREGDRRIGHEGHCRDSVRRCRSNERVDIAGMDSERTIVELARLRQIVRSRTFVKPGRPLKTEVQCVGVRGLFCTARLGRDEWCTQRASQARDDFVLHVEEIGDRLIEPLRPKMTACLGIDELNIDTHAPAAALNTALEDITNVGVDQFDKSRSYS